jgi:uncharacterized membrane protein YoaT (DUF817 family)
LNEQSLYARVDEGDAKIGVMMRDKKPPVAALLGWIVVFGICQIRSCAFAGPFLALLAISKHVALHGLARYDFLFIGAIVIQILLVLLRLENGREVAVLFMFHLIGLGLELFKTSPGIGSWSYPEACRLRLLGAPLYSGFMYASVASYIMQAWRIFDLRIERFPSLGASVALCAAIYANFFTDHYIVDLRWVLGVLVLALFWKTRVEYAVLGKRHKMPIALSFCLIGFFIWVAENIATYYGAWVYPVQAHHWSVVSSTKISSWTLLIIISFVIVASLKQVFPTGRSR